MFSDRIIAVKVDDTIEFRSSLTSSIKSIIKLLARQPKWVPQWKSDDTFEEEKIAQDEDEIARSVVDEDEEKERQSYRENVTTLIETHAALMAGYQQADERKDRDTKVYLNSLSEALTNCAAEIGSQNATIETRNNALSKLLTASVPSASILQKAQPIISPVFRGLSIVIGLFVGLIGGAVAGAVGGLGCFLYILLKSNGCYITPEMFIGGCLLFMAIGAAAGVVAGIYWGATEGASYLYSQTHSILFKPRVIQANVQKLHEALKKMVGIRNINVALADALSSFSLDLVGIISSYAVDPNAVDVEQSSDLLNKITPRQFRAS